MPSKFLESLCRCKVYPSRNQQKQVQTDTYFWWNSMHFNCNVQRFGKNAKLMQPNPTWILFQNVAACDGPKEIFTTFELENDYVIQTRCIVTITTNTLQ